MTEEIYGKYSNQKKLIYTHGEHNSPRDPDLVKEIFTWVGEKLRRNSSQQAMGSKIKNKIISDATNSV